MRMVPSSLSRNLTEILAGQSKGGVLKQSIQLINNGAFRYSTYLFISNFSILEEEDGRDIPDTVFGSNSRDCCQHLLWPL